MKRFIFLMSIMVLGMDLFSRSLLFNGSFEISTNNDDLNTCGPVVWAISNRSKIADGNGCIANLNYGCNTDYFRTMCINSDITPPSIQYLVPIIQDTVLNTGPFDVYAVIKDSSGIDTAWLVYQIDGGVNQYIPMVPLNDSTFLGTIPGITYNHRIDYHVHAIDNSIMHNDADGINRWFYIKQGPPDIIIGTGNSTNGLPFWMRFGYTRSASMYRMSDIGYYGNITNLAWNVASALSTNCPVQVYLKSTTEPLNIDLWNNLIAGATLVYNGTTSFPSTGWKDFLLATPFNYSSGNLLVLCEADYGGTGTLGYPTFYSSAIPSMHYFDYTNGSFNFLGHSCPTRPNLKISFQPTYYTADAGITSVTVPDSIVLANVSLPVKIVLKNYAVDTLDNVKIKWRIDGVFHDSISWSGVLPPSVSTFPFVIDNEMFSIGPHTIKAWTEKPNGMTDQCLWQDSSSMIFFACASILNGTYTIGGGGDFATFNDALYTLLHCGVSGPVVFNVANGTYKEKLNISKIPGASAINTVTFQSASGNYNDVILSDSAIGTADNYVVKLDGADFLRFSNITIQSTGIGYSCVVEVYNGATNNVFEGNRILDLYPTSTAASPNYLVHSSGGTNSQDSANTFNNNIFENGGVGLLWNGPSSTILGKKTVITNNMFINQYSKGIQVGYQDGTLIASNTITTNSVNTSFTAIATSCINNLCMLKNTVKLINGGSGLIIDNSAVASGNEGLIANNMISIGGTNTAYGMYCSDTRNLRIYYNSVNVYTNTISYAFRVLGNTSSLGHYVKNNIFAYTGAHFGGLAAYIANTAGISSMDYNDLYSTGTNLGYWAGNQATLAAWKAASSKDTNSVSVNPEFISAVNLHSFSLNIADHGIPVSQVTEDIDGEPRDLTTPDIGADELEVPAYDAKLSLVVLPVSSCGHSSAEDVSITVKNNGADPITNIDVYYVLNNGTPVHEVIAGPIPQAVSYTYTFAAKANLSANGTFTFDFYINIPADANSLNDSIFNYAVYNGFDFLSGPYTMGFESNEFYSDWSKLSVNGDNYTWEFPYNSYAHGGARSARFYNTSTNANGDWLFSRCFPLQAGETYDISYWYRGGSTTIASRLNLRYGLSATPAGMTHLLDSLPNILSTTYQHSSRLFVAPTTDSYYFGWYAYTIPGTTNMYVDDINISYFPSDNIAALDLINPVQGCTYGSEAVSVKIVNIGFDTIQSPFEIGYKVSGNPTPVTETVNYLLLPGDSVIHTFITPAFFNVLSGDSTFQIKLFGTNTGDVSFYNDTVVKSVLLSFSPPDPITINDTIPYGTSATLEGVSPYLIRWYDVPVGGSIIDTGAYFTSPVLYGDATYYAEIRDSSHMAYVGPYDNTIGGSGATTNPVFTIFDILNPSGVKIKSIDVFPGVAAGAAYTIIVQNSVLQQIASYSGVTTVAANQREIIPVNFNIPFGTDYRIGFTASPNMQGNISGTHFPYTLPGFISITGTTYTDQPDFYFYFYHWKIDMNDGCTSHRVPAHAVVTGQPNTDAGIVDIIESASPVSLGTQSVNAILRNYGTNSLTSVDIDWTVNGIAQPSYNWTGSLPTGGSDTIVIGTYDFEYKPYPGLNDISAWSHNPNSQADNNINNDTISVIIDAHDTFAGTYYIRTSTPDFASFTQASLALKEWGVSAPVLILADTGIYTEQIFLTEIPGASDVNTITFRSITGINTDVVLQYAATGATNNYVLRLIDADFIAFEEMTLKSVTTTTYGLVVELRGGANYNRFENNIIQSIVTTSNNAVPVYSTSSETANYNSFIGNKILNGYYGVSFGGSSPNHKKGNQFDNNEINGWYQYGMYVYLSDSTRIRNNIINNSSSSETSYSIYLDYCDNGCIVNGNRVITNSNGVTYGIYLDKNNITSCNANIISNNFINCYAVSGTFYGIYLFNSNYLNVCYNSVNIIDSPGFGGIALYQLGGSGNINIINNNLVNTASGYVYYILTPAAIGISDYNNFYTTGTELAYWGSNRSTLALLQGASGKDVHSKSVVPLFYSPSDLHSYSLNLYRAGTTVTNVNNDIDGETRNPGNSCIGADEFQLKQTDAGISNIEEPNPPDTTGICKIRVSLTNFGLDTLTSVAIKLMINGVPGTTYQWSGALPSMATLTNIIIDSAQFIYENYDLQVWTEFPNDTTDLLSLNDTAKYSFFFCPCPFKGTYTIGNANCDFLNFDNAIDALNHCGIDSAVVFKVYPGTYFCSFHLDSIHGASNANTITFTSLSGNNNDVILHNQNDYNSTITFWKGASHYVFDHLTIESTSICQTIDINAHDIRFSNNVIKIISSSFLPCYVINGVADNLLLENNDIIGGFYGIFLSYSDSLTIRNNNFTDFGYSGVYFMYSDSSNLLVSGNYFRKSNVLCQYPYIEVHHCSAMNLFIEKNIIDGPYLCDGILISNSSGTPARPMLISNNFISLSGGTGLAIQLSLYVNVYNNSILIYGSKLRFGAAYIGGGRYTITRNNIFSNLAGGYAYMAGNQDSSDFNNIYSTGPELGEYNASTFNDLAGLQALSGNEVHSISVDPSFISDFDLHINNNPYVNGAATPVAEITTDIDGDIRNSLAPDIGADEFDIIVGLEQINQSGFILHQNQPNPTSSSTSIYYCLPSSGEIVFELINDLGQVIVSKTEQGQSGLNRILICVAGLRSGIYLYSVSFKGERLTRRLSVVN